MITYSNALRIRQGENFTIDKLLVYKNNDPFIVSNKLLNCTFDIIVKDPTDKVRVYSLPVRHKFFCTRPVELSEILCTQKPTGFTIDDKHYLHCYTKDGQNILVDFDDYVFKIVDEVGNVSYEYAAYENDRIVWHDYNSRLICAFTSEDTRNWPVGYSSYCIKLVGIMENMKFEKVLLPKTELHVIKD